MSLVSVIIPCRDDAGSIAGTLESVLAQSAKDVEIVVVDDGSTDDLARTVGPYRERIKLISQGRLGGNAARNKGFDASSGEFVIFLDADMRLRPDALQKLTEALDQRHEAAYAYSSFRYGWKFFRCGPFDADRLRRMNFISTASLIRRERFPRFDETLRRFQDWDLWLTMLEAGDTGVWVPEALFTARVRRGGISSWLPSLAYELPWKLLGWRPARVAAYEEAADIVRKKHRLAA